MTRFRYLTRFVTKPCFSFLFAIDFEEVALTDVDDDVLSFHKTCAKLLKVQYYVSSCSIVTIRDDEVVRHTCRRMGAASNAETSGRTQR